MRAFAVVRALGLLPPLLLVGFAGAQPAPSTARDTMWWAPIVRHGWIEGGVGWMAAPTAIRRNFEAGQGFGAGLETRPSAAVRLRVGGDYQILPANGSGILLVESSNLLGDVFADTVRFATRSAGWMGALRTEAAVRIPGHVWLLAGGGRLYLDDGLGELSERLAPDMRLRLQGAYRDGWAWFATAGALLDLESWLHAPLSFDVRWRSARRGDDDLRFWTIRVGYLRP